MTDTTPRLSLPLLHAAQAQKEFTHNEALLRLDALTGGVLAGGPLTQPPADPPAGSLWLVAPGATGAWAGQADRLAIASPAGWRFVLPPEGFACSRPDGAPVRRTAEGWTVGEGRFDRLSLRGHDLGGGVAISDPSGGGTVDAEARVALAAILSALRDQGLIAGSSA